MAFKSNVDSLDAVFFWLEIGAMDHLPVMSHKELGGGQPKNFTVIFVM